MSEELKSLVNSLVAKELLPLCIGAAILIFVALNGSSIGGVTIVLTKFAVIVLMPLGISLSVIGLMPVIKAWRQPPARTQRIPVTAPSMGTNTRKELEEQVQQITKLKQAIYDIRNIALDGGGMASNQILKIINTLNLAVRDYEAHTNQSILTVKWLEGKVEKWVEEIQSEDYPDIDPRNIEKFREDVRKCLYLIILNIKTGIMSPPRHHKIKFQCDSFFSYKAAIEKVKEAINRELQEFPQFALTHNQTKEVMDCFDEMKKSISHHFERGYNA